MLAAFVASITGEELGLSYGAFLLQLNLGIGLCCGVFSFLVNSTAQLRMQLADVQWQAAIESWSASARPTVLLAAFALIQVRGGALDLLTMLGLLLAGLSIFVGTYMTILGLVCGGETRAIVDVDTGDIAGTGGKILSILKALGQVALLFAAQPMGAQLLVASTLARLALVAEVVCGFSAGLGRRESLFAEACADTVRALQAVPFICALAIMDHIAWGSASFLALPFQPSLYIGIGLSAQVALVFVLHFGCGGGLKENSPACSRVAMINNLAGAGVCLGLLVCIWRVIIGTYEFSVSQTGITIQWGEWTIGIAIVLASIAFLTKLLEYLAPEQSEELEAHSEVAPGVSEPMKKITTHAAGMILGLVAMQMNTSQDFRIDSFLTAPLRLLGFPLCAAAMLLQVFLLIIFTAFHCDVAPVPEPPLEWLGTLQWEPESETGRKVVGGIQKLTFFTLVMGLFMGILGMGMLQWIVIKLAVVIVVFPLLPKQGKSNIIAAFGWSAFFLKSCLGSLGSRLEAYMEHRRKISEAAAQAAAKGFAEALAAEESEVTGRKASHTPETADAKASPKKKVGGPKQKSKKKN